MTTSVAERDISGPSTEHTVHVNVLGPIELIVEGRPTEFTSPRLRQLLAVLAAHANLVVSTDRLVDIMWPADDEVGALRTLRTNIWRLRNLMGAHADTTLLTRQGGYVLVLAPDDHDAARFEVMAAQGSGALDAGDARGALLTLDDALRLWRGCAYEGYETEEWARPIAVRLDDLRVATAERRVEALMQLGRTDEAISDLALLLAHDPLRERTRALHMRALYRDQRQAEALRSYADFRSTLAEELGIEPSPQLRQLERAILEHDLAAIGGAAAVVVAGGYELREAVATTPVTVTYRAAAPRTGEPVLLTVVDRAVACDPAYVRVFEVEAQRLRSISHPNLVAVTDCWRDGQGAYFVTPDDLEVDPFASALGSDAFVHAAEQASGAVQHLHANGLTHGNLGTDTIQFDRHGIVNVRPGGLAMGRRGASVGIDQRDLATWLASIAPPDLSPPARAVIQTACARTGEDQFESVAAFSSALIEELTGGGVDPAGIAVRTRNPYVGLRAFQESDADVFFGRQRSIKAMLTRLGDWGPRGRLLAVIGASGSGKSSLVQAGLLQALRDGELDGSADWFIARMTPGDDPFAACQAALDTVAVTPLADFGDRRTRGGDILAGCVQDALPSGSTLVIVVDQFEEIFAPSVNPTDRLDFIDMITAAAMEGTGAVRIVLTLRADFYDRPLQYPRFGQLLHDCHVVATAPTGDDLVAAIQGPAEIAGLAFEPGLVRALVHDFERDGSLPLLQHALAELGDRRDANRLTLGAYDAMGGLAGGLARRAEAVFESCPRDERSLVRPLFTSLVTVGEGSADTRRRVRRRDLDGDPATVDAVLERFGAARLLTFDHDRGSREPTVEIAHDALIGTWDRLAAWIDEDRDSLLRVRHLGAAASAWADRGRDENELYRGGRLEAMSAWVAASPGMLRPLDAEFVAASEELAARESAERETRAEQQRIQQRRLRRRATIASCAALLALIAGSVAVVQSRRADDRRAEARDAAAAASDQAAIAAEQRDVAVEAQAEAVTARDEADVARDQSGVDRLVAQAIADADQTPARALLLAAAAYDADPSPATAGAMQSAIVAQPAGFAGFLPTVGETSQVQIGESLIVRHTYDSVEIIDRSSRTVRVVIPDPTTNTRVSLSADDALVALAGPTVRVFDTTDGSLLAEIERASAATDVDFDPTDRSRLAVGYDDGSAEIVAWETGTVTATLAPQGDVVRVIAFSPDGRHVATATGSRESALRIWDAATGLPTSDNLGVVGTSLYHSDIAFDRTGTRLASVDRGGVGRLWTVPDGVSLGRTARTYGVESLHSLEFESDDVIVASGPSGVLRRWAAADGRDLGSVEPHAGLVTSIALDPAGETLLVGGNEQLALFDLSGSTPGHTVEPFPPEVAALVPTGTAVSATISADGETVVLLAGGGVWVWERSAGGAPADDTGGGTSTGGNGGTALKVPVASTGTPVSAALSPDGTVLAVAYLDFGRGVTEIVVFDTATLGVSHRMASPRGPNMAISPDNRLLAIADISSPRTPTLDVHDLVTDRRSSLVADLDAVTDDVDPLRGAWVSSLSFSPDSRLFAAANHRGAAMIWDTTTLEPVGEPLARGGGAVLDLEFGASSDVIVGTSSSNEIWVLDVDARERIGPTMQSPSGLSIGLAMSPDGSQLLSGGSDGIQLWDVAGGSAIGRPYPVPTPLGPAMQWLADTTPGASTGGSFAVVTDRGVETWTTDPTRWRSAVCDLAGRSLTDDEWTQFGTRSPTPRC